MDTLIIITIGGITILILIGLLAYRKRREKSDAAALRPTPNPMIMSSPNFTQSATTTGNFEEVAVTKTRTLDAAIAREMTVGVPTELVAQVRLDTSPGLQRVLELDVDYDPRPEDVKSHPVPLEFPLDEQLRPQGLYLLLKVSSLDFSPPEQTKKILVPPRADSEPCVFHLVPMRVGELGILLEVYSIDELMTASTKIRIICQQGRVTKMAFENRALVSLPLETTVRPFHDTKKRILAARHSALISEYKAVARQTDYELSMADRLRLERKARELEKEIQTIEEEMAGWDSPLLPDAEFVPDPSTPAQRRSAVGRPVVAIATILFMFILGVWSISEGGTRMVSMWPTSTSTGEGVAVVIPTTSSPTRTPSPTPTTTTTLVSTVTLVPIPTETEVNATVEDYYGRVRYDIESTGIYSTPGGNEIVQRASSGSTWLLCALAGSRYLVAENYCSFSVGWIDVEWIEPLFNGEFPFELTTPFPTFTPTPIPTRTPSQP
jgi:hypothetical protein